MATTKTTPLFTMSDLEAIIGSRDMPTTKTTTLVNYSAKKISHLGAALVSAGDHMVDHYDLKRVELKALAALDLKREREATVLRINAAMTR